MGRRMLVAAVAVALTCCSSGTTGGTGTSGSASPTVSGTASPAASGPTSTEPSGTAPATASPTGGSPAAAVSKADFLAKAKPICTALTDKVDALAELPDNDNAGAIRILDQRASLLTDSLAKLKALTPPTADAAKIRQLLADLDLVLADTTQEAAAYRAGDTVKAAQLEVRFDNDEKKAKSEANDYGLGDCGA